MRLIDLQDKDVINVCNGEMIGYVADLEIDECLSCIQGIVVEDNILFRILCFFKKPEQVVIPLCQIVKIGEDVILVNLP